MSKLLHLLAVALLLCVLNSIPQSVYAQCDGENSTDIFLFTPGLDTIFVGDNCSGIVDFGMPFIEPTAAGQRIDLGESGIDAGLTSHLEGTSVNVGEQISVYYIGAEGEPDFRRDTFCYTIDVVDGTPPSFVSFPPNDTVCITNIPMPLLLEVMDNCNFELEITDDTLDTDGFCNGGLLRRSWRATDVSGNRANMSQLIFVEGVPNPLPIDYTPTAGVAFCDNNTYETWIAAVQDSIEQAIAGICGVDGVVHDGPASFTDCGTMDINFNIEDVCGGITTIATSYTNLDTIAPIFVVPPVDRIESVCSFSEVVADPTSIIVSDNCDSAENISLTYTDGIDPLGNNCGEVIITRTWTATDGCGNSAMTSHVITVRDTVAPDFDLPMDLSLDCGGGISDISNPSLTGNPTNISDNCSANIDITSVDSISGNSGLVEIYRTWTAEDACGNQVSKVQIIQIFDTIAPTFDLRFRELDISCADLNNTAVTGEPEMIFEQCSSSDELEITFTDSASGNNCTGNGAIIRTWRITDAAGNFNEISQELRIEDDAMPTFTRPASDGIINCADTMDVQEAFDIWVANRGGAIASDNCTSDTSLVWMAFNAGTNDLPSLGPSVCGDSLGIYRTQAVDFVVQDLCGNVAISTAAFSVVDDTPPAFGFCPSDTTLTVVGGNCSANFMLIPPRVVETCGADFGNFSRTIQASISSDDPGNKDVPVNRVQLSFPYMPSRDFPFGNVSLSLNLFNVDADQGPEFFNVYLENGDFVGVTSSTPRCGNSFEPDVLTNLTEEQMIQAAGTNGRITFFLEPNIPAGQAPEFAISDICGNSSVEATLSFDTASPNNMTYWYTINDGIRFFYDPFTPIIESLSAGINIITYIARDCAGNESTCSYQVIVSDSESPGITCPEDVVVTHDANACTASYTLPLPEIVTNNCILDNSTSITIPTDSTAALLTFTASPDLGDFLVDDVFLTFENIDRNTINDVSLIISIRGDVDNDLAFFRILGEDGSELGTTRLGQANVTAGDCETFSETFISIPAASYNAWAADGNLSIIALANRELPFPASGPGDGFNDCNDALVNVTGDNDGTSMLFASLRFDAVQYSYYTEGATETPLTVVADTIEQPALDFAIGTTEVFYLVSDANMNIDTCSFSITVEDNEPPVAVCNTATTIMLNPAGFAMDTILPAEINLASTDNCGIDSMYVFPDILSCDLSSEEFMDITLTVIDVGGNEASCVTPVRVVTEAPTPSFFITPCEGDSLYLYASPPQAPPGVAYTYAWSGPNNFTSSEPNPIIPNPDTDNEGSYSVMITGTTACTAVGSVEVSIDENLVRPSINAPEMLCSGNTLQLSTDFEVEGDAMYFWYQGTYNDRTSIGTTTGPSLGTGNITIVGTHTYFVEIEVGGCLSNPSELVSVTFIDVPNVSIMVNDTIPCEGESLQFSSDIADAQLTYNWTSTNGFRADVPNPTIEDVSALDAGIYYLQLSDSGCPSSQDSVVISVRPSPARPILLSNTPICEGDELILSVSNDTASIYHWLLPNNNSAQGTFENSFTVDNAESIHDGEWRAYVTSGGCNSELSAAVAVEVNPVPDLLVAAERSVLCEGGDLMLQASPTLLGATYRWTAPNGEESVMQNPTFPDIGIDGSGIYTCTLTTDRGCTVSTEIAIQVGASVVIDSLQNTGVECTQGPTDISLRGLLSPADDGTYQYLWTGPNGFSSRDAIAVIPNATEINNGNYTLIVTNGDGCASDPQSMVIDIREAPDTPATPRFNEGTQPPFCEGDVLNIETTVYSGTQVEYHWITPDSARVTPISTFVTNDLVASNSGEYAVYVVVDGCQSLQSGVLRVDVATLPQITAVSNSPVCEGSPLSVEANIVPGATYRWTGPSGITASGSNPVFAEANKAIHEGTYTVEAEVDGCASDVATVAVAVNALPRQPVAAASPQIVCTDADDALLRLAIQAISGTQGASYTWYDQDFNPLGTLTNGALVFNVPNLDNYEAGTYQFYVQAEKDSCFSVFSNPVEVTFSDIPAGVAYAGEDFPTCGDTIITMNASAPSVGTGMWTVASDNGEDVSIIDPNNPATIIAGLEIGNEYLFAWTLSNASCEDYSTDTVRISIRNPDIAHAGRDTSYCGISSFFLGANLPADSEGMWTQSEAQELLGVEIEDPTDPNTAIFTNSSTGQDYYFTWTLTSPCGTTQANVVITISSGIPITEDDFSDCGDGCTEITAIVPPTGSGEWYSPDIGIGFNDPSSAATIACGLQDGQNMFIWEIDGGACGNSSRDTLYVTYEFPAVLEDDNVTTLFGKTVEIDVTPNDFYRNNQLYTFDVAVDPLNGSVEHLGDGVYSYRPNSDFVGTDIFTYQVCAPSSDCACVTALVSINVAEALDCAIPNIFTPNGDGVNDTFVIPCLATSNFPDNVLSIFNQWGDEVYRKENYDNSWDGTFDGTPLPTAYYYYYMDFNTGDLPVSGSVLLYR